MGQLLLVRHGQASFGAADYDVLSDVGWEQGRALGTWLREADLAPTTLIRGDMRRHRETLEAILDGAGWAGSDVADQVQVDADWNEFDHVALVSSFPELPPGELDRRAFQHVFEQATAAWIAGTFPAEGAGETFADFVARVRSALGRAAERAGSGQTAVVVTSGGAIAVAASLLVGGDDPATVGALWSRFNTVIANSSVTRVVVGPRGPRLLTFNEHAHAVGSLLTYR
ncbi:histidine phosphatase family protein [Nocardioides sp. R-C-SC26]|uniref:histidine phosphatase family protein n=1 Tax=Nocardioides sp. R-C-SC26 TaxID=2870414 RepID=UPI001E45429C|nr:histidine phosphatase family protein [Nocardioides sp. R-C-SC26]